MSRHMNNQLYCNIWEYSDSGRASWLHEFAWQKIPVKPLKFGVEGVVTAKQAELDATQWYSDQRIKQWKEKHKYEQHSNT